MWDIDSRKKAKRNSALRPSLNQRKSAKSAVNPSSYKLDFKQITSQALKKSELNSFYFYTKPVVKLAPEKYFQLTYNIDESIFKYSDIKDVVPEF